MATVFMLGSRRGANIGGGPASASFVAANRAVFVPVTLDTPTRIRTLFWGNGATVTGSQNLDIGIYTFDGTKLVSSGSTAQSGTSTLQTVAVDITLSPGWYYLALAENATAGTVLRVSPGIQVCRSLGMAQMDTAFPLPATATFAVCTSSFIPLVGMSVQTTV